MVARFWGWAPPNPGLGPAIELFGGDLSGALDLSVVGEGLAGERFLTEGSPPGLSEPMLLHVLSRGVNARQLGWRSLRRLVGGADAPPPVLADPCAVGDQLALAHAPIKVLLAQ